MNKLKFTDFLTYNDWEMRDISKVLRFMVNFIDYNPVGMYNVRNSKNVYWPDDILNNRKANCVDVAIFMYLLSSFYHFECSILFVGITPKRKYSKGDSSFAHAVPIIKLVDDKYYIYDFMGNIPYTSIHGPFDTLESSINKELAFYQIIQSEFYDFKSMKYDMEPDIDCYIANYESLSFISKYKNKPITQNSLFSNLNGWEEYSSRIYTKMELDSGDKNIISLFNSKSISNIISSVFKDKSKNILSKTKNAAFCKGRFYHHLFKPSK